MRRRCKIGFSIYCVMQCFAFVFFFLGVPLGIYNGKDTGYTSGGGCLTLWGYKTECYDSGYAIKIGDFFPECSARKKMFVAAQVFSLLAVLFSLTAFICGIVMCCACLCMRIFCLIQNVLCFICSAVVVGIILAAFLGSSNSSDSVDETATQSGLTNMARCGKLNGTWKLTVGFGFIFVGMVLDCIAPIFIFLPC